jgi:hypothetical protein
MLSTFLRLPLEQKAVSVANHTNFNPLSAMVTIWHHIIVSFKVFGTERVHLNLDMLGEMHQREVHWGKESLLIGGCRQNGLRGYEGWAAHSANIHQSLHHKSSWHSGG